MIRTIVPILVGVVVGQAARLGVGLAAGAVTAVVTPVVAAVFAAVVRWVEVRYPAVGRVLLSAGLARSAPVYRPVLR
ncbi:hypothetical protein [Actinomadura keratinilytica]|uniref:hypothetical protein n=1 Tax=Actinomadura keratinilytica TaxID=547461 RepID=UPI0031ED39C1